MRKWLWGLVLASLVACGKVETIKFPVTEPDGHVVEVQKYWGYTIANDDARDQAFTALKANRVDEALSIMKAKIAANPKLAYDHYNLAICYEVKGDWKNAYDAIEEAIKRYPANSTFTDEKDYIVRHLPVK